MKRGEATAYQTPIHPGAMPERPDGEIDFFGTNSVGSGRFAGLCMSNHGKPRDLMAWGWSIG